MSVTAIRAQIATRLVEGPAWLRSLHRVKPVVDAMLRDGELGLVAPPNGQARNMVALTRSGAMRFVPKATVAVLAVSEREQMDRLAELVAEGESIAAASRRLGISQHSGSRLFTKIRAGLGAQAV